MLGRSDRCGGSRRIFEGSGRRRKSPLGAKLDRDEMHDDLQFASCELPNHLHRARHGADQCRHHDQQCDFERIVPDRLLDPADQLSDGLCQNITLAVIGPASNCRD